MTASPKASDSKLPLHDEAQAREKWRGGETILEGDEDDLGLPAREADQTKRGSDDDGAGRPGEGRPGDFPPPD